MKKSKLFGRLGVLALALTLISTCFLGGTLAKYTTTSNGTGTVNVAKWTDIKYKDGAANANFTVDLAETKDANSNAASTKVAPGDVGSFSITLGASDVAYGYSVNITSTNLANDKAPIKFYSDAERTTEWTTASKDLTLAQAQTEQTVTIYWAWDTANSDVNDTAAGSAASAPITFDIAVTATQTTAPVAP